MVAKATEYCYYVIKDVFCMGGATVMQKWGIITDSSCDYKRKEEEWTDIHFAKVPFIITVGETDYTDDEQLNVSEMVDAMERCPKASHTSCPSPQSWLEQFMQQDNTIAITISGNLSGSYNSAITAKNMLLENHPEKKVFVLDSCSAGSALTMYALKAAEFIRQGMDFEKTVEKLQEYVSHCHTVFTLSSFDNLVKNGRMSRLAGFIAGKLGFWGIGIGSREGKIEVKAKVRGVPRMISGILEDMRENGFEKGEVVIAHCQNPEVAEKLKNRILETWGSAKVSIQPTIGLCSYYAERGGLIVGY